MAHSRLHGKTVLVTGGAVRLGAAICRQLSEAGAHLAIHCHQSGEKGDALAAELRARGGTAEVFVANLSQTDGPASLVAQVASRLGGVDVLVNSAARFDRAPFTETPLSVLEDQWALNARAPFLLTQAVVPLMRARGGGDVVNLIDVGGTRLTVPRYAAYGMTKAALAQLTQTLAVELAPLIRVNGVAPGTVLPPEGTSPADLAALRARIPADRLGNPEDVAQTVLFLLTGPAFITGEIIAVDGGRALAR